ncbi:colicin E3/pyocin S6 family cytotoxin [Mycoavidus sp. B2-EB]|uniref:colicin E3/pyocin S6 family cytotoxin n=1 Tax=Mycoavidus sp. B2-EB TaxID=2651972 RepID=UPI0018E0A809|nr:colicin E3/pyocin S6 family cytotoxin [Mycoavidus sp. B2-EB]
MGTFDTVIFSKMASSENNRENLPKADNSVWHGLQNSGNGIKLVANCTMNGITHNDIEVYNKNDDHMGSMDPVEGNIYKSAVPGRKLGR